MSDQIETVAPVVETAPVVAEQIQLPDDHPLVKTLAAQKQELKDERARVAALKEKADRLDALDEAAKTEQQKLQERLDAAEAAIAARDQKDALATLITEVAEAKKVPAAALRGSTREELEEHADVLLASITPAVVPVVPSADGLGVVGTTVSGSDTGLDAAIAAAEKARNFPLAITLKQQKAAQKG